MASSHRVYCKRLDRRIPVSQAPCPAGPPARLHDLSPLHVLLLSRPLLRAEAGFFLPGDSFRASPWLACGEVPGATLPPPASPSFRIKQPR